MFHVTSSKLEVRRHGTHAHVKVLPLLEPSPYVAFVSDAFEMVGTVTFAGDPSDTGAGCRLGFSQYKWIDTNRASYRGQAAHDGTVEIIADRPPARPTQACRDHDDPTNLFAYSPGDRLDGIVTLYDLNMLLDDVNAGDTAHVSHGDRPQSPFPLKRLNSKTGKMNYLVWAQRESFYCSTLIVQRKDKSLHQLQTMYWNVSWNRSFELEMDRQGTPRSIRVQKASTTGHSNRMHFGHVIPGDVTDPRFAGLMSLPSVPLCNDMLRRELAHSIVTETAQ